MSLFPKPQSGIRYSRTLVRGVWEKTGTPFTFSGTIQPLSGQDILTLDHATRDKGKVWVRTTYALRKRTTGSDYSADEVVYNGAVWEIIDDRNFDNGILPHHKYLAEYRGPA